MTSKRYFSDEPAQGKWMKPGTSMAAYGHRLVGNAYRAYLARNGEATTDAQHDAQQQREDVRQEWLDRRHAHKMLDAAVEARNERLQNAWKENSQ